MAYDILIKGGRIYDGSGLPSYIGDVAVQDGRIVDTGRVSGSDLFNPDFAALARAYGWQSATVDRTEQFEPALRSFVETGEPTLLHLKLDADVITSRTTLSAIREQAFKRGG